MEYYECSPFHWADSYYQEEAGQGIEELKDTLLYTLELESAIACAHEEISRKGEEVLHFKCLLTKTVKERDEAELKYQELILENMILQQKLQQLESSSTPTSSATSDDTYNNNVESRVPLSSTDDQLSLKQQELVLTKGLPENGKFLQTLLEAGPLLQTLLLAGPLPQWQHPPPQLNSIEIPPVTIPSTTTTTTSPPRMLLHQDSCASTIIGEGLTTRKRSFEQCCEDDHKPPHYLHQQPKACSPIIIDQNLVF